LNLSRQFLDMLRLKVTNQVNRYFSTVRLSLDLQMAAPLCLRLPFGSSAMLVPKEGIE
jgi:hypothetical protein